ncbi:MAG: hypothetical protein QM703_09195 [Gemmatales bacterium]
MTDTTPTIPMIAKACGSRWYPQGRRLPLARLECGDVIVAVDGKQMCNPDDLHRALHATGHRGILSVRDARTGRFHDVRVYPRHGHIGVNVTPIVF